MEFGKLPWGGAFRVGALAQIGVRVGNLARAVGFYRDILGLRELYAGDAGAAFMDAGGGVRLMLAPAAQQAFDHPSSVLYFAVPKIHAGYQALVERGVRFVQPPIRAARLEDREVWVAMFRDSEGNVLALLSEQAPNPEPAGP